MSAVTHADRARLAHRALRLRENGFDTPTKLKDAAAEARKFAEQNPGPQASRVVQLLRAGKTDEARKAADEHVIVPGPPTIAAIGQIAQATLAFTDPEDTSVPTDAKLVERFMGQRSLDDLWREWNEATTANLEATLSDSDLAKWRKAEDQANRRFEERMAAMRETGEFDVHPYFGHMRHTEGAANSLYDEAREGFLVGQLDWDTATFKWVLVDSADYTVNLATHEFLSSVAAGGRVATSGAIANKTSAAGVADGDDGTLTAVTGDVSEALILVQSSAVGGGADVADTAQRLCGYVDTATGLPVTPNGGNINIVHDSGSNRIFKL